MGEKRVSGGTGAFIKRLRFSGFSCIMLYRVCLKYIKNINVILIFIEEKFLFNKKVILVDLIIKKY